MAVNPKVSQSWTLTLGLPVYKSKQQNSIDKKRAPDNFLTAEEKLLAKAICNTEQQRSGILEEEAKLAPEMKNHADLEKLSGRRKETSVSRSMHPGTRELWADGMLI